jgi:acylphosphatase
VGTARLTATVRGSVQGVGFRAWVLRQARGLPVTGWARNTSDGTVEVVAQGEREAADQLLETLRSGAGRPGRVTSVEATWTEAEPTPAAGFTAR